jgi:hypothetical protein
MSIVLQLLRSKSGKDGNPVYQTYPIPYKAHSLSPILTALFDDDADLTTPPADDVVMNIPYPFSDTCMTAIQTFFDVFTTKRVKSLVHKIVPVGACAEAVLDPVLFRILDPLTSPQLEEVRRAGEYFALHDLIDQCDAFVGIRIRLNQKQMLRTYHNPTTTLVGKGVVTSTYAVLE